MTMMPENKKSNPINYAFIKSFSRMQYKDRSERRNMNSGFNSSMWSMSNTNENSEGQSMMREYANRASLLKTKKKYDN